jgi:dihydrofolate synthase/folylpolyglutamate synthase
MDDTDIQHLFSLRNEYRSLRYDIKNIQILCEALGHPQEQFRSVLIAGTNGKGSVAHWLSAMLGEAGLYVSPHLERLNERISIGGIEIDDLELGEILTRVQAAASDARTRLLYPPTYFELVTASAFEYFSGRVRYAVLEVGLGGRLDATNLVSQDLSVITNIGYDHQEYLGSTIEEIAAEKAGIIKGSEPVVLGAGCEFECIRARAGGRSVDAGGLKAEIQNLGEGLYRVDLQTPVRAYGGLRPRLGGRHQIENLKVAVRAAECLEVQGWPLDVESIIRGVNQAIWPGRLERFAGKPTFLVDGGHNVPAAEALGRYLDENCPEKVWLIFGGMEEKDCAAMIRALAPHAKRLILTRVSNARSSDPKVLGNEFPDALIVEGIAGAVAYAREHAAPETTILITGSLYLAGEARAVLEGRIRSEAFEQTAK